jgi:hypothetical protein
MLMPGRVWMEERLSGGRDERRRRKKKAFSQQEKTKKIHKFSNVCRLS